MSVHGRLVGWLREMHALERQQLEMLQRQVARLTNYCDLRRRIQEHVYETQKQVERLELCLARHGEEGSRMKDVAGKVTDLFRAPGHGGADSEVRRCITMDYALERFEIGRYRSIITAAIRVGDDDIVNVCRRNMEEEEAMARWVFEHLGIFSQGVARRDLHWHSGDGAGFHDIEI